MFQNLGLLLDRVGAGWEVHVPGGHGIIYPTFKDAIDAIAAMAGARPGDVSVRRDGSVLIQRDEDEKRA